LKNNLEIYFLFLLFAFLVSCSDELREPPTPANSDNEISNSDDSGNDESNENVPRTYNLLSLGDSYTIGQSVCETCRFPELLKASLINVFPNEDSFELNVIAQTGWTTTNLINSLNEQNISDDHDLVTLLIGVNNQFQGMPFSIYETEFPALVDRAISYAHGDPSNVIVLSIPDYAFTPFGQNFGDPVIISSEIDEYNEFAQNYCSVNGITFLYITDISRLGLEQTDLVASDGLHPSTLAYSRFVERLLPLATQKLE
jgi:lysophospholipase L1-like esterase